MEWIEQVIARRGEEAMVPRLDHRRGSVLFIGAHLPGIARAVIDQGMFVTVVESSPSRMEQFLAPLKPHGFDQKVSWDRRPYATVEFLSSSYNAIIAWESIPEGMDHSRFFKKVRMELKAGGVLYLRARVAPSVPEVPLLAKLSPRLPEQLKESAGRFLARLQARLAPRQALDGPALEEVADRYLNLEENLPMAAFIDRLKDLPEGLVRVVAAAPAMVLDLAVAVDGRLLQAETAGQVAAARLYRFAKTKEFGRIFML